MDRASRSTVDSTDDNESDILATASTSSTTSKYKSGGKISTKDNNNLSNEDNDSFWDITLDDDNDGVLKEVAVSYDMTPFNEYAVAIDENSKEAVILKEITEIELAEMPISKDLLKAISCLLFWVKKYFANDFSYKAKEDEKFAEFATYIYRIANRLLEMMNNDLTIRFLTDVFIIIGQNKYVLPTSNGLLVVLFFAFLYDEKDVIKALEEESHRSTLNRFFAKMLFICNERPIKQQAPKVQKNGEFAIGLIKSYLENYSCSRQILIQFLADMPNFSDYPQKFKNTLDAYSACLLKYVEGEREYGSLNSDRSTHFQKNLFPVLITLGFTSSKLLPHIRRNKNWDDLERRLEILMQGESLSLNGALQQADDQQQTIVSQIMNWFKKTGFEEQFAQNKMKIYSNVLDRIRKKNNTLSIEHMGDPKCEAVLLAAFIQWCLKTSSVTKEPHVCIVVEETATFLELPITKTLLAKNFKFFEFDGADTTVFQKRCIVYCSRAVSENIPKTSENQPIFAVAAWIDPVPEKVERLMTLSPTMLLVNTFAKLYLREKESSDEKYGCVDDITDQDVTDIKTSLLKYIKKKDGKERLFNHSFFETAIRHSLENEIKKAAKQPENDDTQPFHFKHFELDSVSTDKKEISWSGLSKHFFGWVFLTDCLPERATTPGMNTLTLKWNNRIKHTYGDAKQRVPFLMCDKKSWLTAIRREVELNVGAEVAVVVTTKRIFYEMINEELKKINEIYPYSMVTDIAENTQIQARDVLLLDITQRTIISSAADIHVVSTCFPSDDCQYRRLMGVTMCDKNLFTQRFVVNKEHMPADFANSFSYWKWLREEVMESDRAKDFAQRLQTFETNIFRIQFNLWTKCHYQRDACLNFYAEVMAKMKSYRKNFKKSVVDFTDSEFQFFSAFKDKLTENLNLTTPMDIEQSVQYGKTLAGQDLNSKFKHFCYFTTFEDLLETARNSKAVRFGPTNIETILFMKKGEDPEEAPICDAIYNIPMRHQMFKDRLACHLEYERGELVKIKMFKGSFVFHVDENGLMDHFEKDYSTMEPHTMFTIYWKMKEGQSIYELLKEQSGRSTILTKLLEDYQKLVPELSDWAYEDPVEM